MCLEIWSTIWCRLELVFCNWLALILPIFLFWLQAHVIRFEPYLCCVTVHEDCALELGKKS